MDFKDLSKEDLVEILEAYDKYVRICDDENISPVCIQYFYENEMGLYQKGHCNSCGSDLKECGIYTVKIYEINEDEVFMPKDTKQGKEEFYCGECGELIPDAILDALKIPDRDFSDKKQQPDKTKFEDFKKEILLAIDTYGSECISIAIDSDSNLYYGEHANGNNIFPVTKGYPYDFSIREEMVNFCKEWNINYFF